MSDAELPTEASLSELAELRRRVAELESAAVDSARTRQQLVTDARSSQVALRRSEAMAHAVLESASEGIILIDPAGCMVLVNAAALHMFGYEHDDLIGQPLEILLPERVRTAHAGHRRGYFAEPRLRPMGIGLDLAGRRKDGTEFPVEISLSYVEVPDGIVAIAFITDITERKLAEAQLQRQREVLYQNEKLAALGTLAAGIAHEMNNPLGIMTTRIEVMLLDAEEQHLPTQVREDLQVLHRAGQRVARIAASLRSFARQLPGERMPLDLNTIVDEALLLMQKPLGADNIHVHASLDRTLSPMLGDANSLHQVLMNLLTNAREAMPDGGEIRIDTGPAGRAGWLRLRVADTGPGIPAEVRDRVLERGFSTKARDGSGAGRGIGLALVRETVERLGGSLVIGDPPGARVTVTLPVTGEGS